MDQENVLSANITSIIPKCTYFVVNNMGDLLKTCVPSCLL